MVLESDSTLLYFLVNITKLFVIFSDLFLSVKMSRARVPLHIALPSFSRYTCACMRITLGARCKAVYVRSGKSFASPILMAEPFSARESIENERFAMCHCATTTTTISSNKTYRYVVAVHMGTRAQWFLSAAAAAGKANGFALSH